MRLWMALAALLPACGFDGNANTDAGHDAAPDGQQCFGTFVRTCFSSAAAIPTAPKQLDSIDIDTDASPECNQDNDQAVHYCVVTGAGLTVMAGKKVTAHGSKALILLSTATIDLLGDVDVSSRRVGSLRGAGANPAAPACSFVTPPVQPLLGGGAYGGSFGSKGGSGSPAAPASGNVGTPGSETPMFPVPLRGGCKGGDGAVSGTLLEGHGGDGGGAVAFIAMDQIHINNVKVNASGAGGHGGPSGLGNSGGGGGGSGGMIYFESPKDLLFEGSNRMWANGGGGGQGGTTANAGVDGNESSGPAGAAAATNGPTTAGNDGGAGSLGDAVGGDGQSDAATGGGGGGGGGAGVIHAPGLAGASSISPSSTSMSGTGA